MTAIGISDNERTRRMRGLAFMMAGIFLFTLQDLVIKIIAGRYPVHEIVFVRNFVVLPIILVIAHIEHGLPKLATARLGAHIVRSTIMFLAYTTYYLGIAALPLATNVAISFSAPLFITALAVPLLGEKVGPVRWLAVIGGFAGVIVVMGGRLDLADWAVILPVFSSLCYALSQLHARHIGVTESGATLSFYLTLVFMFWSGLAGLVLGSGAFEFGSHPSLSFLLRAWEWPALPDLGLMGLCGLLAGLGVYGLTQGYRMVMASEAALFEYTALPWSILWGFLFFAEIPGLNTLAGVAIVIVAGLTIAWRSGTGSAGPKPR